jgi:hypothetical protein
MMMLRWVKKKGKMVLQQGFVEENPKYFDMLRMKYIGGGFKEYWVDVPVVDAKGKELHEKVINESMGK